MKRRIKLKNNRLKAKSKISVVNKMRVKRNIHTKKTSVKKKIIFTVLSIILILGLLQAWIIKLSYSVDSKYSEVVTQIGMSGQVVSTMKKLDPAISDHILRKDNGEDLTQNEDLKKAEEIVEELINCLLYTSDAADDLLCVDLGGRRIIKKKNTIKSQTAPQHTHKP